MTAPRVFRLRTKGRFLTYHVEGCRYLRNRADRIVEVDMAEVDAAIDAGRFAQVEFEGGTAALNVCLACWRYQNGRPWPDQGRVAAHGTPPPATPPPGATSSLGVTPSGSTPPPVDTLPPSSPTSPATISGAPFVTRQVRITYGGDELTVMPVLNRPDEPASLAAVEALLQLRFEVQDVETGLHPAGALTGGEVAAELMARAVIHQEMQRREDRR